jgi:fibronectin-binding autotransporter adhesin
VAHTGTGSLDVRSNAAVYNQAQAFVGYAEGSEGNVLVRESGGWASFDDLVIGRLGQGQLNIASGGMVVLAEDSRSLLGTQSGGWGQASVTGSGSRWINSGGLIIGLDGGGLIEIVDGAQVEAGIVSIADSGPVRGVVIVGPDGQLSSESTLFVGRAGIGSLSIDAGEVVNTGNAFIGASPGAIGEVHLLGLSGPGARWHSLGNLVVGSQGDGLLTLAEGTEVEADGQVRIASIAGSSGTIRVFDSGSLSASAAHGGTQVRIGGRVEGNGTITGGMTVQSGGVVAPATSSGTIGTLRVTGALNLESSDSILEFKLSNFAIPPDPVEPIADRIEVDGDLTLNGTLNATVTGMFIPGVYTLLTYTGTLVDNGLTIGSLPAPPDGYSARIDTSSQPGEVRLVVESASDSLFSDRFEP